MSDYSAKLEPATLATVGGGLLEQRFQEALAKVPGLVEDFDTYVARQGKIHAQLQLTVDLFVSEDGNVAIQLGAKLKAPKTKGRDDQLYMRDGQLLTWANEPEQIPLAGTERKPAPVTSIGDRR